eukprot:5021141-Pleurochrysis_carterae.AAC.1
MDSVCDGAPLISSTLNARTHFSLEPQLATSAVFVPRAHPCEFAVRLALDHSSVDYLLHCTSTVHTRRTLLTGCFALFLLRVCCSDASSFCAVQLVQPLTTLELPLGVRVRIAK